MVVKTNSCDYGHETCNEIRVLPLDRLENGSNILICNKHYKHEMSYRKERAKETNPDNWDFPTWESLKVYEESRLRIGI